MRDVSSLQARPGVALPREPGSVTLEATSDLGGLLTVDVMAHDSGVPVAAADFSVTFQPVDGNRVQVLELDHWEPGPALAGDLVQLSSVDATTSGRADVSISRIPNEERPIEGSESLIRLVFRARRVGQALVDVAPNQRPLPCLLTAEEQVATDVGFFGGITVDLSADVEQRPGQRIGLSLNEIDFGEVELGASTPRKLRVLNFGHSDLGVTDVRIDAPQFTAHSAGGFRVLPFGFVELPLVFTPSAAGESYAGELVVTSDDEERSQLSVALWGRGAPDADGDGVPDRRDNCPDRPNADQADADADEVGDSCDNCLHEQNPEQVDADGDDHGDRDERRTDVRRPESRLQRRVPGRPCR